MAQLALAWVVKVNPYASTVILGAIWPEEMTENLKVIDVVPRLAPEIMERIETALGSEPKPAPAPVRKPYDNLHALA